MDNSNSPENFAAQQKAVVAAPAGCGKTELIADSIKYCNGRQLVLTHTHAGIDSLRSKFHKKGIQSNRYNLETIHSFALQYSAAYPSISKIPCKQPKSDEDYPKVIEAANVFLGTSLAKEILLNSYSGIFVDEYQDCTIDQHNLILKIADILPCRIVGDYLQGIFDFGGNRIVAWEKDVYPNFKKIEGLKEPYRWKNKNYELGRWLLDARSCIENKKPIYLSGAPITWNRQLPSEENKVLLSLFNANGSVLAVCAPENPNKPHSLAENQKNRYRTIEPITSDEICKHATDIENNTGEKRLDAVLGFAYKCLTNVSTPCKYMRNQIDNARYRPREDDKKKLHDLFNKIISESDLQPVRDLYNYLMQKYIPTRGRDQLWNEMKKGLEGVIVGSYEKLENAVWQIRNIYRFVGRKIPSRCISRTVLIKGLECEHGVVIDADSFDSKNLYVALTRASCTLTILSNAPVLIPEDYRSSCPTCGNKLLPRYNEDRKIPFMGCSRYPSCKYTQRVS